MPSAPTGKSSAPSARIRVAAAVGLRPASRTMRAPPDSTIVTLPDEPLFNTYTRIFANHSACAQKKNGAGARDSRTTPSFGSVATSSLSERRERRIVREHHEVDPVSVVERVDAAIRDDLLCRRIAEEDERVV